jgi:molybdate transport system regulatory protein
MKTTPVVRFRIDFSDSSYLGPGKVELMEAIKAHGSISAAARAMKLSYRRAWLLLESLNASFIKPVSVNIAGGIRGGGTELTPFGELLILRYREVERRFGEIANSYLKDIQTQVKNHEGTSRRIPLTKQLRQQRK